MVSTIGRGSALVPELNDEEKCIGKTKLFLLAGGPICFLFSGVVYKGPWAKIEEIRKSSKFSLHRFLMPLKSVDFLI